MRMFLIKTSIVVFVGFLADFDFSVVFLRHMCDAFRDVLRLAFNVKNMATAVGKIGVGTIEHKKIWKVR